MPKDKVRVGILRGGIGEDYTESLRDGGDYISHILENLSDTYTPVDILVDRDGLWHAKGMPILPVDLVHKVDLVWNLSHPSFSNILESFSVPHIGVPPFSSFVKNSRAMLEEHMKAIGVKMPRHIVFPAYQKDFDGEVNIYATKKAKAVFEKFSSPWIVKSLVPSVDSGIHVAKTFPQLIDAIADMVKHNKSILVEELIDGPTASTHSIKGFRDQDIYVFPVSDLSEHYPQKFSPGEKEKLINIAKDLHNHLGARHYLKSDFVVHSRRGIFLTGVSFLPDLTPDSHFDHSVLSVGAKMHNIIEHILENALSN